MSAPDHAKAAEAAGFEVVQTAPDRWGFTRPKASGCAVGFHSEAAAWDAAAADFREWESALVRGVPVPPLSPRFSFSDDVSEGDTSAAEVEGFTVTATIYRDDNMEPPWKAHDGHGPVSDWRRGPPMVGERELSRDGVSAQFYNFAEAVKIAERDGWGPGTPEEAAEADFQRLRAWCRSEWFWVGVAVTVSKAGVRLTGKYDHAVWGAESDCGEHLAELAEELLAESLPAARAKLAELAR